MRNILIHGENSLAMQWLLQERGLQGAVDLVYIDPLFATKNTFTASEDRSATISASRQSAIAYADNRTGQDFLNFLRERIILIYKLLSERGSLYLHTDYKIGHYVKVMLDEVFGSENFRNDIARVKCNPKNFARVGYGNIKDMILFYTKGNNPIWNEPFEAYSEEDIATLFPKVNAQGRRYTTVSIHAPGETINGKSSEPFLGMLPPKGRHWRTDVATLEKWDKEGLIEWSGNGNPRKIIFADEREGKRIQDIWELKDPQYPTYPTEKNAEILHRIIAASSRPESIVMDCFCGSGTTLKASHELGRKWTGIDESPLAIDAAKKKLGLAEVHLFADAPEYEYHETHTSLTSATMPNKEIFASERTTL